MEDWEQTLEADELNSLVSIREELQGFSDWEYGITLISDNYLEDYFRDELEDFGYIPKDFPWWIVIDFEATYENMKQDYTYIDFDGIDYWVRNT